MQNPNRILLNIFGIISFSAPLKLSHWIIMVECQQLDILPDCKISFDIST